jgi:hypothetical protein
MAQEYFNQIHRTIYLNSGKSLKLSNKDEVASWLARTKEDFVNIAYYINNIAYPIFSLLPYGPTYEFDALQGLAATTLITYPEEHGGTVYGPDCYWVKDGLDGGRPATVKETLDCILAMVTNQEVIVQTQETDLSDIESKIQCLTQNDLKIIDDAFGCNYTLNCTPDGEMQFSLARHIYEILKQVLNAPASMTDALSGYTCPTDPTYPTLSVQVDLSDVNRDICFQPKWVCSFTGAAFPAASLQSDLECITSFIGGGFSNNCSPQYSNEGPDPFNIVNDGTSLIEAIYQIDRNLYKFRDVKLSAVNTGSATGVLSWPANDHKNTLALVAGNGISIVGAQGAGTGEYQVTLTSTATGSGGGFWSQTGTNVYPTTITDNVGIGTATPGEKLEVDGNAKLLNQKELRFEDGASKYVGFKAPAVVTADHTYTLPNGYGTSGQVLTDAGGNGTLSWTTPAGGGGTPGGGQYSVQYNEPAGTFAGGTAFVFDPALALLSVIGSAQTKGHITCYNSNTQLCEQFGFDAKAGGDVHTDQRNTAVGNDADAGSHLIQTTLSAPINDCTAIGYDAQADYDKSTAVGSTTRVGGASSPASENAQIECTAIGYSAQALSRQSTAIGAYSVAEKFDGADTENVLALGGNTAPLLNIQIGYGDVLAGAKNDVVIKSTSGDIAQSDDVGQNIVIRPGSSVGTSVGGDLIIATSPKGTVANTLNPAQERLRVQYDGAVKITSGHLTFTSIVNPGPGLFVDSTTNNLNYNDGTTTTDLVAGSQTQTDQIALIAQFFGG